MVYQGLCDGAHVALSLTSVSWILFEYSPGQWDKFDSDLFKFIGKFRYLETYTKNPSINLEFLENNRETTAVAYLLFIAEVVFSVWQIKTGALGNYILGLILGNNSSIYPALVQQFF